MVEGYRKMDVKILVWMYYLSSCLGFNAESQAVERYLLEDYLKCIQINRNDLTSYHVISQCPPDTTLKSVVQGCHNSSYLPATDNISGITYRNKFCALCHGQLANVIEWKLKKTNNESLLLKPEWVTLSRCDSRLKRETIKSLTPAKAPSLGYSTLLNFGLDGRTHIMLTSDTEEFLYKSQCMTNQIYNPFAQECVRIDCPLNEVSLNGECLEPSRYIRETKHLCMDYHIEYNINRRYQQKLDNVSLKEMFIFKFVQDFNIKPHNILFPTDIFQNTSLCTNGNGYGGHLMLNSSILHSLNTSYPNFRITDWNSQPLNTCGNITVARNETYAGLLVMSVKFRLDDLKLNDLAKVISPELIRNHPFAIAYQDGNRTTKAGKGCINSVQSSVINTEWCNGVKNEYINDQFELLTEGSNITGVRVKSTNKTYYQSQFQYTAVMRGKFWGNITQITVTCDRFPSISQNASTCAKFVVGPADYTKLSNGSIRITSFEEFAKIQLPGDKGPRPPIKSVFTSDEYEYLRNASFHIPRDLNSIEWLAENRSVLICLPSELLVLLVELELWDRIHIKQSCSYLHNFGQGSTIAGIVCSAISMIAMILVLLTYSLFKSLRTLPGVSLMHLTTAVMLSQITFLAGLLIPSKISTSDLGCFTTAVITHYFILTSFMWMNVMAFCSYRAFGADLKTRLLQMSRRHIVYNCLYGWGIPAVIVFICAIVDYVYRDQKLIAYGGVSTIKVNEVKNTTTGSLENIQLTYKTMGSCWIGNSKAAFLIFGVPLVYSVVVNLALFIKTCLGMREPSEKGRPRNILRRDSGSGRIKDRNEMSIHLRLSAQYGFAWIFAIVIILIGTSKTENEVLCYVLYILNLIFNILNGCTGLFIFFAFICNRRIFYLYKSRFLKKGTKRVQSVNSIFRISSSKLSSMTTIDQLTPPQTPNTDADTNNNMFPL